MAAGQLSDHGSAAGAAAFDPAVQQQRQTLAALKHEGVSAIDVEMPLFDHEALQEAVASTSS